MTIGQHDVALGGLEPIGGELAQLLGHLAGGCHHRAPVVEQRLRTSGAHVVRGHRRVLVHELEARLVHAQLLGGELAQGHHRAGAALLGAGDDLPGAVSIDLHVGARWHREARPPTDGDSDRLVVGELGSVPGRRGRGLDALLQTDLTVGLAAGALDPGVDRIASPELDGIESGCFGHLVGVRFECPARL
ncbi:MAG: hypothetical protein FD127_1972, partial [Acidimicrobiaceae bacterium]